MADHPASRDIRLSLGDRRPVFVGSWLVIDRCVAQRAGQLQVLQTLERHPRVGFVEDIDQAVQIVFDCHVILAILSEGTLQIAPRCVTSAGAIMLAA